MTCALSLDKACSTSQSAFAESSKVTGCDEQVDMPDGIGRVKKFVHSGSFGCPPHVGFLPIWSRKSHVQS